MCTEKSRPHHTNEELYRRQVEMLRQFLQKGAITQAQFDKSFGDLTKKMHLASPQETENAIQPSSKT